MRNFKQIALSIILTAILSPHTCATDNTTTQQTSSGTVTSTAKPNQKPDWAIKRDTEWAKKTPTQRAAEKQGYIVKDRHIQISPQAPKEGINNGWVILYGHRIRPPYKIEYQGEKLFVNGVQAVPSLVFEREYANVQKESDAESFSKENDKRKYPEKYAVRHKRRKEIFDWLEQYCAEYSKTPAGIAEIMKYINAQKDMVEDARWTGTLLIQWSDPMGRHLRHGYERIQICGKRSLPIVAVETPTKQEMLDLAEREREGELRTIQKSLMNDGCVAFETTRSSSLGITFCRGRGIADIMLNKKLSPLERENKLAELTDDSVVADILTNSNPDEWK